LIDRALVLGGLGFIGSNLALRLADAGARVTVVSRSRKGYEETAHRLESRGVHVVVGDVRDARAMAAAVAGQSVVFHAAGRSGAVASMEDPLADLDANCRGTLVVLEALRAVNREAKIVFVGSRLEYGHGGRDPIAEDRQLDPLCVYAVHKLAVEHYLRVYSRLYGIRFAIARVTNPYGPGQPSARTAYGVVNQLIHRALEDATLTIYGDGLQRRDYIFVDDVSDALMALASARESDGRTYNVGTGIGTSLREVAETIARIAGGGRVQRVDWPAMAQQIETGDFVADVSRIEREVGWRPSVTLEDGLQRTVAFYRAHIVS
jgi:UDP-glucose 4-epimerase